MMGGRNVRIKICGITSVADAVMASQVGADAIGINFYPSSPRYVSDLAMARAIALAAGPFVTVVGLFVNSRPELVERALDAVPLNLLQFHGNETPADCERFARPYIKALRMKPGVDIEGIAKLYKSARGILLDAYRQGIPGGTGEVFDWDQIPAAIEQPLVLAGGLNPTNVAAAVAKVSPWAVDVSGGVETYPGKKDLGLMQQFIEASTY
jgi:phosphoribosylanthranilate isomerase